MDEGSKGPAAREGGLRVAQRGALPRDAGLGFPRGRRAALAEHRERRVRLASMLLAVSLLLGIGQLGSFFSVSLPSASAPGAYAGQLTDARTDAPVVNATVRVVAANVTVATDASGNFTIRGIPSGRTDIVVSATNYVTTTFTVFANPLSSSSDPNVTRERLRINDGSGSAALDTTQARDAFVGVCLVILVAGLALTAVGFLATLSRRRYSYAILGGVGAVLAVGFYVGALLGLIAVMLLRGAREQFADPRSLFAPGDVPLYTDEEDTDDEETEESEEPGEGEEDEAVAPPGGATQDSEVEERKEGAG